MILIIELEGQTSRWKRLTPNLESLISLGNCESVPDYISVIKALSTLFLTLCGPRPTGCPSKTRKKPAALFV